MVIKCLIYKSIRRSVKIKMAEKSCEISSYSNSAFSCEPDPISLQSMWAESPMPPLNTISLNTVVPVRNSPVIQQRSQAVPTLIVTPCTGVHASKDLSPKSPAREDDPKERLLNDEFKDTEKELPTMQPLPQAVRKLFWSIVLIAGAFCLALQLGTVGITYLNSRTAFVRSSSRVNADMPAVTLCTETKEHLEDGLRFNVDIEKLYKYGIVYPRTYLQACTIGGGYSCLDEGGEHHNWTNILNPDEACSTLRPSMKVEQGHSMKTEIIIDSTIIEKEQFLHIYMHDSKLSLPTYYGKEFLFVGSLTKTEAVAESLEVTVAAEQLILSDADYHVDDTCIADEDYDRNKEQDKCIDEALVKLPTNCSFPWMSIPYRSCISYDTETNIIKALEIMSTDSCKLPWPCQQWSYSKLRLNTTFEDIATMRIEIEIDDEGIKTNVQEDVEWPKAIISSSMISSKYFEFVALIGASVAFFCCFSVLGLLNEILDVIFPRGKDDSGCTCPLLRVSVFVLCWAALIIQVSGLAYFFSYQTTVVQQKDGNLLAHDPISVTVCSEERNTTFFDLYLDSGDADIELPQDYVKQMFVDPISLLESCIFFGEHCENHTELQVTSTYYHDKRCDTIKMRRQPMHPASTAVLKVSSTNSNVSLYIHPDGYFMYGSDRQVDLKTNMSVRVSVQVTQQTKLPECKTDHNECLEDCFHDAYIKKTPSCSMPGERTATLPACNTAGHYFSSLKKYKQLLQHFDRHTCNCQPLCFSESYQLSTSTEHTTENKRDALINLKPAQVTQIRQLDAYSTWEFLYHIGGCLALITGTSLLSGFIQIANSLWILYEKEGIVQRDTKHMLIALAVITGHAVFAFVMIEIINGYIKKPVGTEIVMTESLPSLPSFTLCLGRSNSSDDIGSMWTYIDSTSLSVCKSPDECKYVQPKSVYDILEHKQKIDTSPVPPDLGTCTFFGHSCEAHKGPIHTWTKLSGLNAHCYLLHLDPEKLAKPVRRKMLIEMKRGFTLFVHDSDEAVTQYSDSELKVTVPDQQHHQYLLKMIENHRFNHSGHSCYDNASYSKNQCLTSCAQRDLSDSMNCTLPWMKSDAINLDICFSPQDYKQEQTHSKTLDAVFFNKCKCGVSCDTLNIDLAAFSSETATNATITILFDPVSLVRRQFWLYPTSVLVINLGGAMALLTGFNLLKFLVLVDRVYCYMFSTV